MVTIVSGGGGAQHQQTVAPPLPIAVLRPSGENNTTIFHGVATPKSKGGVIVTFPLKLHEMLDSVGADGHSDIVSWQVHGRSFIVRDHKRFASIIMPKYFKQTKFPSFQRQLNLYGFQRFTQGRDKGGYYHELFLRGKRYLCCSMVRMKVKGTKVRKAIRPDLQPNFYAMPPLPTLPSAQRRRRSGVAKKRASTSVIATAASAAAVPFNLPQPFHLPHEQQPQHRMVTFPSRQQPQQHPQSKPDRIQSGESPKKKNEVDNTMITPPLCPLSAPRMDCPKPPPSPTAIIVSLVTPPAARFPLTSAQLNLLPPPPVTAPLSLSSSCQSSAMTNSNANCNTAEAPESETAASPSPLFPEDMSDLSPQTVDFLTGLYQIEKTIPPIPAAECCISPPPPEGKGMMPVGVANGNMENKLFFEGRPFYDVKDLDEMEV